MPKTKISEFSATPGNNTDIDGINIAEGCAPSGINDAIRELMSQLKDWQSGTSNDPMTIGSSGSLTLSYGTANGVAYLNGSKVLTTGSALTFDGSRIGLSTATSNIQLTTTVNTNQAYISLADADGRTAVFRGPNSGSPNCTQIGSVTNHDVAFLYGNTEQMRLTSTGLGIGTSSPTNYGAGYRTVSANGTSSGVFELQANGTAQAILVADNTDLQIQALGARPIRFFTNGSLRATLDSAGNLGLGVTPSAWESGQRAFDFGITGTIKSNTSTGSVVSFGNNCYYGSSSWRYKQSSQAAALYDLRDTGEHRWYTAPSGTAGNAISFTQAMTLDASGNLGVGDTSPSSSGKVSITVPSAGYTASAAAWVGSNGTGAMRLWIGNLAYAGVGANEPWLHSYQNINIGSDASIAIKFISGGEKARIDSSGNLLVGTTSAAGSLAGIQANGNNRSIMSYTSAGSSAGACFHARRDSNGNAVQFVYGGWESFVGSISVTASATAYNTSSDYRLKENIQPMTGALAKVQALKPCTYNWKADGSEGEGFIAHELAEVVPQCVTGEKDAVDAEGKPVYQGIDTSFLVATLAAAIQELNAKVQALESQLKG